MGSVCRQSRELPGKRANRSSAAQLPGRAVLTHLTLGSTGAGKPGGLGGIFRPQPAPAVLYSSVGGTYTGTRMFMSLLVLELPLSTSMSAVLVCTKHTGAGSQQDEKPVACTAPRWSCRSLLPLRTSPSASCPSLQSRRLPVTLPIPSGNGSDAYANSEAKALLCFSIVRKWLGVMRS